MIYELMDISARLVELWNAHEHKTDRGIPIIAKSISATPSRDYPANDRHGAFTSLATIDIEVANPREMGYRIYSVPLGFTTYDRREILEYALQTLR